MHDFISMAKFGIKNLTSQILSHRQLRRHLRTQKPNNRLITRPPNNPQISSPHNTFFGITKTLHTSKKDHSGMKDRSIFNLRCLLRISRKKTVKCCLEFIHTGYLHMAHSGIKEDQLLMLVFLALIMYYQRLINQNGRCFSMILNNP